MCDTVVATGNVTADGVVLFGKNSDREPNEAQYLVHVPSADHPAGSYVRCTYIEVPQVQHTYAVLLSKPYWIWGAEMGINEHGVAIGNEAVFTKLPHERQPGLIGMDLLRLALERAASAREAVSVIIKLLARYGQGGNCSRHHRQVYHNSFLIADPHTAWVLETAGRQWAAKEVEGVYTISNGLTIGTEWDLASDGLIEVAVRRGWCRGRDDFHFARCYSDFLYTTFSASRRRRSRTMSLLGAQAGHITVDTVIATLRDHGGAESWHPDRRLLGMTVCAHASFGPALSSQTAGSLVSHLDPTYPTHFVTGTAAPCTGIFKPVWIDTLIPGEDRVPSEIYDEATLFWRHEILHRLTLRNYPALLARYRDARDALERRFLTEALAMASAPVEQRAAYVRECFAAALDAETRWTEAVRTADVGRRERWLHRVAWRRWNRQAGIEDAMAT